MAPAATGPPARPARHEAAHAEDRVRLFRPEVEDWSVPRMTATSVPNFAAGLVPKKGFASIFASL